LVCSFFVCPTIDQYNLRPVRKNLLGYHLASNDSGSRFAYSARVFLNDSIYHDIVSIYDAYNGEIAQVGSAINCYLNFEDTLVSRRLNFDMSADGENLIFNIDSVYFYYSLGADDWELKDKIVFDLNEGDFINNFSLAPDGKTLCIARTKGLNQGYAIYTFEKVADRWVKMPYDYFNLKDIGSDISLSFDGMTLATSETISWSNNILQNKVKIFTKTDSGWIQKGNDIDLFGSIFLFNSFRRLLTINFSKNSNTILISGIGEEYDYLENNVYFQMYEFENDIWNPKGNIVNGYHPRDAFGFSSNFSDDGNRFAISSIGVDFDDYRFNGIVKVYDYVDPEWVVLKDSIIGENTWDICGYATALSGDGTKLFVSCPFYSEDYFRAGKIGIYDLSPYTSTRQIQNQINAFELNPNPTSGLLKIKNVEGDKVRLFNHLGMEALNVEIENNLEDIELDLSHLNNGFYFVHIDNYEVQKVVLMK